MRSALVEIVTTVASEEEAASLARRAVEAGLVACAAFHRLRSVYRWEGRVCDEQEYQVTLKTLAARADQVERFLAEHHPYEVPAILRLSVMGANEAYRDWVAASIRGEPT